MTAVIPTYRPNPVDVQGLIDTLLPQVSRIVIADDGSPCTADPFLAGVSGSRLHVVRHRHNAGIARSLNDGLTLAGATGSTWLLTVDQDSEVGDGFVAGLLQAAREAEGVLGKERVGAVAPAGIADASGALGYPTTLIDGLPTTEEVIQTGALWSVGALLAAGGFDERLGMDAVDAAACLALRQRDMRIVLASGIEIDHRLGQARQVRVLGRDVMASGHTPSRRATIVRNRLRLFPAEFAESPVHALRTLRRVVVQTGLAVTVEDDRWSKAKGAARGLLPRRTR